MRPSRSKWIVAGLLIAGFIGFWAGTNLGQPRFYSLGLLGVGAGLTISGAEAVADLVSYFDDLKVAGYGLQGAWTFLVAAFQVGIGLAVTAGGLAGTIVGWEGLGKLLADHPGAILLVVGTAFLGIGVHDLLAIDDPKAKGWKLLAGLPFRLAALPAVVIGLVLILVGLFQTVAPGVFHSLTTQLLGPFAPGP
jgi:hypothetical protein